MNPPLRHIFEFITQDTWSSFQIDNYGTVGDGTRYRQLTLLPKEISKTLPTLG
jgi:hypothetical protein